MTYRDTSDEARQCARESLCEGCEGVEIGYPCHVEDQCDGFKDEAIKIQKEMDEEVAA
jgi:hypothetical protein